jgi:Fe-S cluster biogenesis protein NfuA
MEVLNIQPTPNPNAFKFVVDQTLQDEGSRYYNNPTEATADPLAMALFAVHGVETVYFAQDFATITSSEEASRETLHSQIQEVLKSHEGGGGTATATVMPGTDDVISDEPELIKQIDALLDDRVRPALAGDGGGLQLLRLESKVLTIRYEGACGSCPSSASGTLMAIQNLLQMEVDEELTVVSG